MTAVEARSRGLTYQQLLDGDSRPVPEVLRLDRPIGDAPVTVPVERYTSPAFAELEKRKVWERVWQMACREEDLPAVGDHVRYDIAGHSILVVRSAPSEIKAFHNVCLHRGRLLREESGCRARELRCAFHGFAWNVDGSLKHVPCQWDFPQITPEQWRLPEVRVGTWGGFVFVNLDPAAESLASYLGDLPWHFARWPLEQRYTQAHVAKLLPVNWKVAQEAFMEAYHVVATHPQLLPGMGDANSQYDVFGNFCRAMTPNGTPSPHLSWSPSEQEMLDAMTDRNLDEPEVAHVGDGDTARRVAGRLRREVLRPVLGDAVERLTDAEMDDSFYYTVFPNFHPWGAYNRIVYRFRPNGTKVDESIMECLYLAPFPAGERPPAAPTTWLGLDDDWTDAPELGMLARVFNQDVYNLPKVQAGLEAMSVPVVTFARYQETKLRHFHALLEQHLARP